MENFEFIGKASRFKIFHQHGATLVASFCVSKKDNAKKKGGKIYEFQQYVRNIKRKKRKNSNNKLGTFYIATEKDAVFLHKKIHLKCTCFKNNICKVGFPVNSLEKYIEELNEIFSKDLHKVKNCDIICS